MVNYSYFVDIRPNAMPRESGLLTGLNQLTMSWASPIAVDVEKNKNRQTLRLLESSDKSWVSADTQIQPNFRTHGDLGFAPGEKPGKNLLGVAIEGQFSSYFTGKPSPLLTGPDQLPMEEEPSPGGKPEEAKKQQIITRQLDLSPESARIIVFSSNSFVSDTLLGIGSSVSRTTSLAPVQLMANAVDWSLEDRGLLAIRGRSHFSRPLLPMTKDMQLIFEYANYGLALVGLILVFFIKRNLGKRTEQRHLALLRQSAGRV